MTTFKFVGCPLCKDDNVNLRPIGKKDNSEWIIMYCPVCNKHFLIKNCTDGEIVKSLEV